MVSYSVLSAGESEPAPAGVAPLSYPYAGAALEAPYSLRLFAGLADGLAEAVGYDAWMVGYGTFGLGEGLSWVELLAPLADGGANANG